MCNVVFFCDFSREVLNWRSKKCTDCIWVNVPEKTEVDSNSTFTNLVNSKKSRPARVFLRMNETASFWRPTLEASAQLSTSFECMNIQKLVAIRKILVFLTKYTFFFTLIKSNKKTSCLVSVFGRAVFQKLRQSLDDFLQNS